MRCVIWGSGDIQIPRVGLHGLPSRDLNLYFLNTKQEAFLLNRYDLLCCIMMQLLCFAGGFVNSEDGGEMFLRNVS
jgi:hypothetical protein